MKINESVANTKRQMILKKGQVHYDGPVEDYDMTRATFLKRLVDGLTKFLTRNNRQFDNLLVVRSGNSKYFLATSVGNPDVVFYYFYDAYGYKSHVYVGWSKIEPLKFLKMPADQQDELLTTGQTLDPAKLWNRERSLELLVNAIRTLPTDQAVKIITGPMKDKISNAVGKMIVTEKDLYELGVLLKYLKELGTPETKKYSSDLRKLFKRAALKDIMELVKRNAGHGFKHLDVQILDAVNLLKSKGGNWPELDIFVKRVESNRLKETSDGKIKSKITKVEKTGLTLFKSELSWMKKLLNSGEPWAIDDIYDSMDEKNISQKQAGKIFKSVPAELVKWFDIALAQSDWMAGNIIDIITEVVSTYNLNEIVPDIINVFNKHKRLVLQYLTQHAKESPEAVDNYIANMTDLGVNWTEFKIILKHINQQINK